MSLAEPSAAFPAPRRARSTIIAIGVGIVLLMHVVQPILLRHYEPTSFRQLSSSLVSTLMRAHRTWLINPSRVVELEREAGETSLFVGVAEGQQKTAVSVPVAKERAVAVREALLAGTSGLRQV
jgi:hypothetical protein